MDAKLYGLLIEKARHRQTIAYSETGRSRAVIGPLLDEINRHEHSESRPLLSVIVVHKGTTEPGDLFFDLATELRRFRPGDDKKAFVDEEREWVFRTWAG